MCYKFLYLASLFAVISLVTSGTPSFITKCHQNDGSCYKENAEKLADKFGNGLPEYNVKPMDPLKVQKIDASSGDLKFVLTDVVLTGLKQCKVKKLQRDVDKQTLQVSILCDVNLAAKYDMKGKMSIFQIEGEGDMRAQIKKLLINGEAKMPEFVGKDGKKHWKIPSWTHTFELKDKSNVEFDNLFKGNKELSSAVSNFISSSGNQIIEEFGGPVINSIISNLAENMSRFFIEFSVEDLAEN